MAGLRAQRRANAHRPRPEVDHPIDIPPPLLVKKHSPQVAQEDGDLDHERRGKDGKAERQARQGDGLSTALKREAWHDRRRQVCSGLHASSVSITPHGGPLGDAGAVSKLRSDAVSHEPSCCVRQQQRCSDERGLAVAHRMPSPTRHAGDLIRSAEVHNALIRKK